MAELRVLSREDLAFFEENGYLVVPNAVPPENVAAAVDAIWSFLEMDRNNPELWYGPPVPPGHSIEMYHHQAFWDNRQHPRLHQVFADLCGREDLWVTFDRANFKPPFHPGHPEYDWKGFLHWDINLNRLDSLPFGLQGVLSLTDTDEDMGGFQCVPGHHKVLAEWLQSPPGCYNRLPPPRNVVERQWRKLRGIQPPDPRKAPCLSGFLPEQVRRVSSRAGDLILWTSRLAHGNGRNASPDGRPRMAQYISMFPAPEDGAVLREARVTAWRERTSPPGDWVLGDPRGWERQHCPPADLTPLGRKLLGLDSWP